MTDGQALGGPDSSDRTADDDGPAPTAKQLGEGSPLEGDVASSVSNPAPPIRDSAVVALLRHPIRAALMELLRTRETVTATEAAQELGGNTGSHSFHLRQLARYRLIEPAPTTRGRIRPWRLIRPGAEQVTDEPMTCLARGLEDESYRRWLALREQAPARWRNEEAFSEVIYLTPRELTALGVKIRDLLAEYRHRETRPETRPKGAAPVAAVARLFPLLDPDH